VSIEAVHLLVGETGNEANLYTVHFLGVGISLKEQETDQQPACLIKDLESFHGAKLLKS
jgi:hypothetical protein